MQCSLESKENQRNHDSSKGLLRQNSRTSNRRQNPPKETQTGQWMSPSDQANLARRKVKRRGSLVSVSHQACLETQKFFAAKSKNIFFVVSDMEKPTIADNMMSGCEDLMSLLELAGLLSMQLTNALA